MHANLPLSEVPSSSPNENTNTFSEKSYIALDSLPKVPHVFHFANGRWDSLGNYRSSYLEINRKKLLHQPMQHIVEILPYNFCPEVVWDTLLTWV